MLSSVFARTLRDLRFQILGWGLGLSALCAATVWVYPSLQHMPDVTSFVKMLPPAMQKIIGPDMSFAVVEEFLRLKLFDSWLPVSLCIFAIVHGAAAIVGEEERGTMDLLMANPVRRWRVVLEKFLAIALGIVAMCVMTAVSMVGSVHLAGLEADLTRLALATLNVAPVTILFLSVALAGSCVARHARHATAVGVVLMAMSYFLHVLAPLSGALESVARYSVFYVYARTQPFAGGSQAELAWVLPSLALVFLGVAIAAFRRKDLGV